MAVGVVNRVWIVEEIVGISGEARSLTLGVRFGRKGWQVGHQVVVRWARVSAFSGVVQVRQGWAARA